MAKVVGFLVGLFTVLNAGLACAQIAPSATDVAGYQGLLAAAHTNNSQSVAAQLSSGAKCDIRDSHGRAPVHIAAHASAYNALEALVKGGCDIRSFDNQQYDAITIAAVKDNARMVRLAIKLGGDPKAVTSPYEGTALIAAAHLGHVEVVKALIEGDAPLDHINNLGWTALIEAVVLGDGGVNHVETARALLKAGADKSIRDRAGMTPLQSAEQRGFTAMSRLLRP